MTVVANGKELKYENNSFVGILRILYAGINVFKTQTSFYKEIWNKGADGEVSI